MIECLSDLVGLKELCEDGSTTPLFYLDDAEGIDRVALSQLAKPSNGSGKAFAQDIIDGSARILMADIESLVPKGYTIKTSLNSFCNVYTYTALASTSAKTGVIIKNISTSKNAFLSLDSLKVMIGADGNYTIVLDDGISPKILNYDFVSGSEKQIININFKTESKYIKIYFLEAGVPVSALNCPVSSGCGCSGGRKADASTDITVKGLLNDVEFTTQYGFIPCATIVCKLDNILCSVINQQPRLFALALFYRSVARYYSEFPVTQRGNRNASFNGEEKMSLSEHYMELYYERLRGSDQVKGISDNMAAALNSVVDDCVTCQRLTSTAWAVG